METETSSGAKLSVELSKLDEKLERIEDEICTLKKRKLALLERKAQVTIFLYC